MSWPPSLEELKVDQRVNASESTYDRDDESLQQVLNAAVAFVEQVRAGELNFTSDLGSDLPDPTAALQLGTIRLALRWHARRDSVDGLINSAEFGIGRIPSIDADIERLLGIGRYRGPVFA